MSKRFTETEKWRDAWFRKLTPTQKCLWAYLCDNCDQAGVIDVDIELAAFQIGAKVTETDLALFARQVRKLANGKLLIRGFVRFQYGHLSPDCKPHKAVFACMDRHGLTIEDLSESQSKPNGNPTDTFPIGFESLQEQDKEKEKDKEQEKEPLPTKTEAQVRAEKLFRRRLTTPWGAAELRAWKANRSAIEASTPEDWQVLEAFYAFEETSRHVVYRRQDLATLLNNWSGEIDKARDFQRNGPKLKPGVPFVANERQGLAEAADFEARYGGKGF
jgi:hypothetical protein